MENHEKFSQKLNRLKEYKAITQPAKDGYHISIVRTKDTIPKNILNAIKDVSSLKEMKEEKHDDSGCRILNYKYTFHITE